MRRHISAKALGGQHDAQMLDNDHVLVFANGLYGSDLSHSQAWEIDPATNSVVWRYVAKDDVVSSNSPRMGGAQRLPSGKTLVCEGCKICVFEVTPDGDVVREFVNPLFVESPKITALSRAVAPQTRPYSALAIYCLCQYRCPKVSDASRGIIAQSAYFTCASR